MEGKLFIYKASAGSGKTHCLTGEYIKLLFDDEQEYKHILAVTFTKKATAEMKQRVLEELHTLADNPEDSPFYGELLADERIKRRLWGKEEIKRYAHKVMTSILHDYSAFAISTIDTFFQSIMRAFARELGRFYTYDIELDFDEVLAASVDKMYSELEMPGHENLLKWLIDYSLELINEDKSWKFKEKIMELAGSLGSETFKIKYEESAAGNLYDTEHGYMEKVERLKANLNKIIKDYELQVRTLAGEALEIISSHALSCEDFKGGSKSRFRLFERLERGDAVLDDKAGDVLECLCDNYSEWYRKGDEEKFSVLYDDLNGVISSMIDLYQARYRIYATASVIKENMTALAILGDIYLSLTEYCRENNIILISETNDLLQRIINQDDAPFIYERVGTWIDHFMLDEFQDTSVMQWNNFKPLLGNSLAAGMSNLIVGDLKQSIYRWRNSNWEILAHKVSDEFPDMIEERGLHENYRSARNIIEFNNRVFKYVAAEAARLCGGTAYDGNADCAEISQIYSDSRQFLPEGKKYEPEGYVEVDFVSSLLPNGDKLEKEEIYSAENILLVDTVMRLKSSGYKMGDIAVLVRSNAQVAEAATALVQAGFKVASSDAFRLSSSEEISQVVNILKAIANPDDFSLKVLDIAFRKRFEIPDSETLAQLRALPLYQICETVIRRYLSEIQKKNIFALQSFLDVVLDFSLHEGDSLSNFIKWWDERGSSGIMPVSGDRDAVQIVTIHKSKGLAFDVVIFPYFELQFEPSSRLSPRLWLTTDIGEIGYNAPLPIKYSSILKSTDFAGDYSKERESLFIDNINLAYVAFTRARKELILISHIPKTNKSGEVSRKSVSSILYDYLNSSESPAEASGFEMPYEPAEAEQDRVFPVSRYTVGTPSVCFEKNDGNLSGAGRFSLGNQFAAVTADSSRLDVSLRHCSLSSEDNLKIFGIKMHDALSMINTMDDLSLIEKGEIREKVGQMLEFVKDRGWFSGKYTVLNESPIITESGLAKRPDRVISYGEHAVVIDYKFGAYRENYAPYVSQIREYMDLLKRAGFKSVEGYLWYASYNRIEKYV